MFREFVFFMINLFIIILIGERALAAQSSGAPGAFLRMSIGAKASAMGSAFSAVCNNASAMFWNPAGLSQVGRMQIDCGYHPLAYDRKLTFASAVFPVKRYSSLGIGWVGFGVKDIEARTMNTQHPDFLFSDAENALIFSYAQRVFNAVAIGGIVKVLNHCLGLNRAFGFGFDVGFLVRPIEQWRFALSYQDLKTHLRWETGFYEIFPCRIRLGTALRINDQILFAVDLSKTQKETTRLHLGAEFDILDIISLRTGFNNDRLTVGFGLTLPLYPLLVCFDYAYRTEELGELCHDFSVLLSFKRKRPDWFRPSRQKRFTRS